MGDRIPLCVGRHHFFAEMSFNTAISSIASASSLFSLAFSSSSDRSRLPTALKSYTTWAAQLIGAKGRTGTISVGMAADIAV
jgi:predicted amidohydrolase YtcJ